MFKAILLVHDESACVAIEGLGHQSNQVSFEKTLNRFPQAYELSKLLNTLTPDLVFLDLGDWDSALAAAEDIRTLAPLTAIIGFGGGWGAQKETQCENAGITELLVSPVSLKKFQDCVDRAIHKMRGAVQENLLAFLPAKAGSGCTTIALNLAGCLADTSNRDSLGKKVLLIRRFTFRRDLRAARRKASLLGPRCARRLRSARLLSVVEICAEGARCRRSLVWALEEVDFAAVE